MAKRKTYRARRDEQMQQAGCVSVPVAAETLGLSMPRVYAMARDGTLTQEKLGGTVYVTLGSIRAYQQSLKIPDGLILLTDAQEVYNYSRPTLWRRVRDGTLRKAVIAERAYLYKTELDKLYGVHPKPKTKPETGRPKGAVSGG